MPNHEFEFHDNHLAINVKVRFFPKCDKLLSWTQRLGQPELPQAVTDEMFQVFWQFDAQDLARQYDFESIVAEGKSNGWAVPIYGGKPIERAYIENVTDEEAQNVLMNYFGLRFKIRRIVADADSVLYDQLWEQLHNAELQFLYDRSISARVLQHMNVGVE